MGAILYLGLYWGPLFWKTTKDLRSLLQEGDFHESAQDLPT